MAKRIYRERSSKHKLENLKSESAEYSIIGELLNNGESLVNIKHLEPKHFYSSECRKYFQKILEMDKNGKSIDITTLSNELEDTTMSDLSYLLGGSIKPDKMREYEQIIISNWIRRKLFELGHGFSDDVADKSKDPSEIVTDLSEEIDNILKDKNDAEKLGDTEDAISELIERRVEGKEKSPGVLTGYEGIDRRTGGFQKGDLITIGGDTSTGKTALALNITENIIFRDDPIPVGYISLELSKSGLLDRLICNTAEIDSGKFYNQEADSRDREKYKDVSQSLKNKPLYLVDSVSSLHGILTKINLLYKNYKTRLIFIDNLQNILGDSKQDFRKSISEATRSLKAAARRLNISIIVLSHLSRNTNKSKKPRLSYLKESSSIEQDSDKVILIYRPYKDSNILTQLEECTLLLAKNRQGKTGNIDSSFNREIAKFE
jgi:replicative DNA helicase